jgi:hypothetical protein
MSESPPKPSRLSLGAAVLLALVLLAGMGLELIVVPHWLAPETRVPVVQAAQDLPALTVISSTDVLTASVPQKLARGMVTDVGEAVGRVTTQAVPRGAPLRSGTLLALQTDRWLLPVPISDTLPPAVGDAVALLGVRSDADQASLTIADAMVVAAADQALLVAVTPDEAKAAAPYLVSPHRLIAVRRFGLSPKVTP